MSIEKALLSFEESFWKASAESDLGFFRENLTDDAAGERSRSTQRLAATNREPAPSPFAEITRFSLRLAAGAEEIRTPCRENSFRRKPAQMLAILRVEGGKTGQMGCMRFRLPSRSRDRRARFRPTVLTHWVRTARCSPLESANSLGEPVMLRAQSVTCKPYSPKASSRMPG